MFHFRTKGTPYERGIQQGKACKDLILPWFENLLRDEKPEDIRLAAKWRDRMEEASPGLVEEGRGISLGLGLDFERYLAVLCRLQEVPANCTTFGLRAAGGEPMIGKTDDLYATEVGKNVVEIATPHEGHRYLDFHFAGTTWTIAGMNEQGLTIAMTGIPGPNLTQAGLPSLWTLHEILPRCATVSEVITYVKDLQVVHYGFSLQIADAQGNLTLLEKTGLGTRIVSPKGDSPLVHTNHILDPEFSNQNPKQNPPLHANSMDRFQHATTLAREMQPSEKGLVSVLSNRDGRGAICQRGEGGLYTDFSVIFMPVSRKLVYWQGDPEPAHLNHVCLDEKYFSTT